ncbi:unnamed protein product [Fraxinus pennsylvanica]|uniref:Uncharacterized protein n=1 Tax=Fraxinus pennsylvanica TaxID=56036 RepID=A0AAD2AEE0_9LAMI|nr:unnamed protein product [Fraxinus pennsylvanica]
MSIRCASRSGAASPERRPRRVEIMVGVRGSVAFPTISEFRTVTKAAAQRLAQAMASHAAADNGNDDDGDNDDELGLRFNPPLPLSFSRPVKTNGVNNNTKSSNRPVVPSPKISRSSSDAVTENLLDEAPPARSTPTRRLSL